MPWFRVDDTFGFHSKAMSAGNAALGMWVRAGAWSASTLTGGKIPDHMVSALGGAAQARALVSAGLWTRVDDGYLFHDWDKYQPSKAAVEAEREAARMRQRKAREKAKSHRDTKPPSPRSNGVSHGVTEPVVTVPPSLPIPSLPLPTEEGASLSLATPNSGMLVRDWIESCPRRPPTNVVGQIAKQVKQLLDVDHIDHAVISEALKEWQSKDLHPSVLPSIVHGIQSAPGRHSRQQQESDDFLNRAMARAQAKMGETA